MHCPLFLLFDWFNPIDVKWKYKNYNQTREISFQKVVAFFITEIIAEILEWLYPRRNNNP